MKYFIILLSSLIFLLHVLRVIYLLFKPRFLRHKLFEFPNNKASILGYYLCVMLLLVIQICLKLEIID